MAKQELLATIRDRYRASSKREKSLILDEFIAVTGHHRKHGIRLLGQSSDDGEQQPAVKKGRRIYDEAVRQALIVVWEAADRICGKRLKAALPHLVESMERHGQLADPGVRQRLLAANALHRSDSALGAFLRRKKAQLGAPKAITATAHKLARLIYTMLRYGQEYVDASAEYYEKQHQDRALRAAKRRAAQLVYDLVPMSDAPEHATHAPLGAPIAA